MKRESIADAIILKTTFLPRRRKRKEKSMADIKIVPPLRMSVFLPGMSLFIPIYSRVANLKGI